MTGSNKLTSFLTVRLDRELAQGFRAKAKEFGGTSNVVRELFEAFLEDRLTIAAPTNRKSLFKE